MSLRETLLPQHEGEGAGRPRIPERRVRARRVALVMFSFVLGIVTGVANKPALLAPLHAAVFFISHFGGDLSPSGRLPVSGGTRHVREGGHSNEGDLGLYDNCQAAIEGFNFSATTVPMPTIWPLPAAYFGGNQTLRLAGRLKYSVSGPGGESALLAKAFQRYNDLVFTHANSPERAMAGNVGGATLSQVAVLVAEKDETLQLGTDESYCLVVPSDGSPAVIEAGTVYGALRGLESLSQLCYYNFTEQAYAIGSAPWAIADAPRFAHRGLLVDTSRHFDPIVTLKQILDSMAFAKFNVLHWHIEDEQAFPLEVPSFPRLWEGAYTGQERFSLADVKELVEYARMRGISVMAELDVPGHAASWGKGYPDLWPSATCQEPLDVSRNATFDLIDGILAEFAKVFPYRLLHLGGDEVDTSCWDSTPHISDWLAEHNMTAHQAYAWFVLRAQELAVARGWDPVNWEEPFNEFGAALNPRSVVHEWITNQGAAARAVKKNFRTLVSNEDKWYLDWLGTSWQDMYGNEALDGIDNPEEQQLVLGGEACMWGEKADPSDILQTIWPRAAAVAERLWSARQVADSGNAQALPRLEHFRCLLEQRGVPAAPVNNLVARTGPSGPGSCYVQ